jgi:hypothetical protein
VDILLSRLFSIIAASTLLGRCQMRPHRISVRPDRFYGVKQLLFTDPESRAPILALPHVKDVYTIAAIVIAATKR